MIFELPHLSFFEGLPVNRTYDYEPVSLYLQSRQLRWSYGAMKGRDAGDWQLDLLDRPLEEVVERLALVGFAGITVDRQGYSDGGGDIERRLAGLLQASAVQSANGRYVFFDLAKFAGALRASTDGESWARRQEAALHPTLVSWRGCSSEAEPDSGVHRCAPGAEVELRNTASVPRRVTVEAELAAADGEPLEVSLASPLLSADLMLGAKPRSFARTILLPPGNHPLRFTLPDRPTAPSSRAALPAFRVLEFRVRNLEPRRELDPGRRAQS
jgi:phosphoglycerol transferase